MKAIKEIGIMHLKKQCERDKQRQTCKVCDKKDKFDFYVSEEIWEAVVPPEFRNRVVCLACFDNFAFDKNINYADALMDLCFAGDQASFSFSIKTAVNVHLDGE